MSCHQNCAQNFVYIFSFDITFMAKLSKMYILVGAIYYVHMKTPHLIYLRLRSSIWEKRGKQWTWSEFCFHICTWVECLTCCSIMHNYVCEMSMVTMVAARGRSWPMPPWSSPVVGGCLWRPPPKSGNRQVGGRGFPPLHHWMRPNVVLVKEDILIWDVRNKNLKISYLC